MNMNLKTSSSFILVEIRLHQQFYFRLCLLPYDTEPTLFCSTPYLTDMYDRDWAFGSRFCRVTNFMSHLAVVASVLTMGVIALER